MPIHIMRHLCRPLLLVFQKPVFQIVESLVLFVHRHELLVRALTLQILTVGVIHLACGIEHLGELVQAPIAQCTRHRVMENIGSPPVLDKLTEASFHQLVAQDGVSQERVLRGIEQGHRFGSQRASHGLVISIRKHMQESVYTLGCGTAQGFSFGDYDSALAFAFQKEFNQRVTQLSDGTYSYVTVANESVYSVYQTLSSVNAAVEYYAKKYVSEQKTFSDKSNQNVYYTIMNSSGVADEGALTSNLLTKPSLLNSYSENVYLANSTYLLKQYFDIPSKLELYFVAFDNVLSERKSIPIVYGQTFLEALTAADNLVQGYYLFIESDSCGNVESALLYFDLTAPTLSVAITDGIGQSSSTIDSSYIQATSKIYALSFDISSINDFDEFSFLKIVGGNINSVYVSGNNIPTLNLNTGAGEYVLTLYDRSYNTLEFKVIIAGDKPSLYHSSLSNQTRVSISILLNDRYNALMSLGLFKIDAMGEYTELLYDSDGKAISVNDLDYVLREGGKGK